MPAYSDLTIPEVRYATEIKDYLTAKSVELIVNFYADVASHFGFDVPSYSDVECVGYDTGALPEMRDAAIAYLEQCGFNVRPNNMDY